MPLPGNLEGAAYVRVRARLLYVRGIETMLAALYTMRHTEVHTTMCTRRNVYARSVHGTLARSLTRTHASGRSMHVLTTLGLAAAAAHAPPDHDTTSKVKVSGDTVVRRPSRSAGRPWSKPFWSVSRCASEARGSWRTLLVRTYTTALSRSGAGAGGENAQSCQPVSISRSLQIRVDEYD